MVVAHTLQLVGTPGMLEGFECSWVISFVNKDESQRVVETTVIDVARPLYFVTLLDALSEVLLRSCHKAILKQHLRSSQIRFVVCLGFKGTALFQGSHGLVVFSPIEVHPRNAVEPDRRVFAQRPFLDELAYALLVVEQDGQLV